MNKSERQEIYTRITAKIVASLEKGVRPWIKPWSGENAAGRITRPLRHNGALFRHQHSGALGHSHGTQLHITDLDDISPGSGIERLRPER